jgi:hypothetical protein
MAFPASRTIFVPDQSSVSSLFAMSATASNFVGDRTRRLLFSSAKCATALSVLLAASPTTNRQRDGAITYVGGLVVSRREYFIPGHRYYSDFDVGKRPTRLRAFGPELMITPDRHGGAAKTVDDLGDEAVRAVRYPRAERVVDRNTRSNGRCRRGRFEVWQRRRGRRDR